LTSYATQIFETAVTPPGWNTPDLLKSGHTAKVVELIIEIIAGGAFELFAEFFAWVGRDRDHDGSTDSADATQDASTAIDDSIPDPWAPAVQQSRHTVTAKLMIGASGGAAWGYYVGTSSDVSWPLTFWTFTGIGVLALIARASNITNERFASRIDNRILRSMASFNRARFGSWSSVSFITAACVAAGFLVARGDFS